MPTTACLEYIIWAPSDTTVVSLVSNDIFKEKKLAASRSKTTVINKRYAEPHSLDWSSLTDTEWVSGA